MYTGYPGTGVIGRPVIQETEFSQGATIILSVAVPTLGRTFVSNFKHENLSALTMLPGQLAQGGFTVSVFSANELRLSSPSDGLISGRYLYDITATDSVGNVFVSSLKEFKLLGSVIANGSVLPVVNSTQQLIDLSIAAHNVNLSAHPSLTGGSSGGSSGGAQFDLAFSQANLTSGDLLPVIHTLPSLPSAVTVYDETGNKVALGWKTLSDTAFEIDFSDFVPIVGTWRLSATN